MPSLSVWAVGVIVETVAYKPVRNAGSMSALITALAMSVFLENLAMVLFGASPKSVSAIFTLPTFQFLGATLQIKYLLTLGIGPCHDGGTSAFREKNQAWEGHESCASG